MQNGGREAGVAGEETWQEGELTGGTHWRAGLTDWTGKACLNQAYKSLNFQIDFILSFHFRFHLSLV